MGGSSKPAGNTTSVQTTEPWADQKTYLKDVFGSAQDLYDNYTPSYIAGGTYAPPVADQYSALQGLSDTAWADHSALRAGDFSNNLLHGDYLGRDFGSTANSGFMDNNLGIGAPGSSTLEYFAGANKSPNSPGWAALKDQAGANLGTTNQGASYLDNLARSSGPPDDRLAKLADYNPNANNYGNTLLRNAARSNVSNPSAGYLNDIAAGDPSKYSDINALRTFGNTAAAAPGSGYMDAIAGENPSQYAGIQSLQGFANKAAASPGSGYLTAAGKNAPDQYSGIGALNMFAANGAANPGASALNSYSSGERLAAGNPYMDAVANSVKTRVMPQLQSQFINSGTLSSPEAMRASAAGVASAIAPFAFGQYQNDEQNQLAAANSLNTQALQSRGLQQDAANNSANASLGVNTLRSNVGQALNSQALQSRGLQQEAANNSATTSLGVNALRGNLANQLNTQALQSRGLQQDATQNAFSDTLGVQGLRANVGTTQGSQGLTQQQIQNQAASDLASSTNQGYGLQYGAANNYGNQALQARSLQQGAAKDLSDAALAGGQLQQGAATTLGDQYIRGSGLQNQAATTLGSQALAGRELQQGAAQNYTSGYNAQLDNMLRALQLAPATQDMQYKPWQNLYDTGVTRQNLQQAGLDEDVAKWNFEQQLPYDKLNQYANTVGGQYGGTTTRTDPYYRNRTSNALSGALGGASIGSMFAPGWGTLAGAGIGGISSLFG